MKLATALSERADLQWRITELGGRLNQNAKVQEGEEPAEHPDALLAELDACLSRLEELITLINNTNNLTARDGVTITALIARRDCLKARIRIMRDFLNAASDRVNRYAKTEIKVVSTVPVPVLQRQLDEYSRQLRETDERLQELNWTTELI